MPRTADPSDIPRRLTEVGYLLFNRHGYNATGIQQITEQAGVPKGSFYNHFDSKEAFAIHIVRHYSAWVDQAWAHCLADAPPDALGAIRHAFARFTDHHARAQCQGCLVGNFAAELAATSPACREVLEDSLSRWRQHLSALLARAQAEGSVRQDLSAEALSLLFWDAWEGALLRMKIARHTGPLTQTVGLLIDGLLHTRAPAN